MRLRPSQGRRTGTSEGTSIPWGALPSAAAGTFSPLYGAATLPGATSEWAAGINAADQALVLSHG